MAVFTKVAHIEHKPTLINEMVKELSSFDLTNKYQTTGDTGLKICINQLNALFKVGLNPIKIPKGTAINNANKNPAKTVFKLLKI